MAKDKDKEVTQVASDPFSVEGLDIQNEKVDIKQDPFSLEGLDEQPKKEDAQSSTASGTGLDQLESEIPSTQFERKKGDIQAFDIDGSEYTISAENADIELEDISKEIDAEHPVNKGIPSLASQEESSYGASWWNKFMASGSKMMSGIAKLPAFIQSVGNLPYGMILDYNAKKSVERGEISQEMANDLLKTMKETPGFGMHGSAITPPKEFRENAVTEFFDNHYEEFGKNTIKYDKTLTGYISAGEWDSALGVMGHMVAESLPNMIAMSTGVGGIVVTGAGAGAEKLDVLEDQAEEDPTKFPVDQSMRTINALFTGTAEGAFNAIGTGKIVKMGRDMIKNAGKETAEQAIKKGFMGTYERIMKKHFIGGSMLTEGVEEAANQYTQNVIDIATGVSPEANPMDGVFDAFVGGAATGGFFSGTVKAAKKGKELATKKKETKAETEVETPKTMDDIEGQGIKFEPQEFDQAGLEADQAKLDFLKEKGVDVTKMDLKEALAKFDEVKKQTLEAKKAADLKAKKTTPLKTDLKPKIEKVQAKAAVSEDVGKLMETKTEDVDAEGPDPKPKNIQKVADIEDAATRKYITETGAEFAPKKDRKFKVPKIRSTKTKVKSESDPAFEDGLQDVKDNIKPPTKMKEFGDVFKRRLVDKFFKIREIEREVVKRGGKLTKELDVYNFIDRISAKTKAFADNTFKDVENISSRAKKDGFELSDIGEYAYARYAPVFDQRIAKKNVKDTETEVARLEEELGGELTDTQRSNRKTKLKDLKRALEIKKELDGDIDSKARTKLINEADAITAKYKGKYDLVAEGQSGMTQADIDAIMSKYDEDMKAKIESYANEFRDKITRPNLEKKFKDGMISEAEYKELAENELYVPLKATSEVAQEMRSAKKSNLIPFSKTSLGVKQSGIGRARGGKGLKWQYRENPVVQSVGDYISTFHNSEKNEAVKTLARFVEENKTILDDMNLGIDIRTESKFVKADEDTSISFFEDGQKKFIKIEDKRLSEAISGIGVVKSVNFLRKTNDILRGAFITYNPLFHPRAGLRDMQSVLVNLNQYNIKGLKSGTMKGINQARKEIWAFKTGKDSPEAKAYAEYVKQGGESVAYRYEAVEDIGKRLESSINNLNKNGMGHVFHNLNNYVTAYNDVWENVMRYSAYKSAVKNGMDKDSAITLARNLTVNFNRGGTWSPALSSLYMFSNAGIQGTNTMIRAMRSPEVQRTMMYATLACAGIAQMNELIDPEGYEDVSDFEKSSNIIVMIPGSEKGYIKIPAQYGLNVLNMLGTAISESGNHIANGESEKIFGESMKVLGGVYHAMNPVASATPGQTLAPTAFRPIVQIWENKTFTGDEMVPEPSFGVSKKRSSRHKGKEGTMSHAVAQWLNEVSRGGKIEAGKIDWSPEQIEAILYGYSGGFGRIYKDIETVQRKGFKFSKMPFVSQFYGTSRNNIGKFYDYMTRSQAEMVQGTELEDFVRVLKDNINDGDLPIDKAIKMAREFSLNQKLILDDRESENLSEEELRVLKRQSSELIKRIDKIVGKRR